MRSHLAHVEDQLEASQRLAERLRSLAGSTHRSWEDVIAAIALARQLADPDPNVRLRVAFQSPGTTSELFTALRTEPDPGVREVLVWALAKRPDAGARAVTLLDDPDPDLRCRMVRLLATLNQPGATQALLGGLSDSDPRVVTNVIRSLGQLAAPEAVPALVRLLGTGIGFDADLLDALARIGEAALGPLSVALGDDDAGVRAAAAEAIGRVSATAAATEGATGAVGLLEPLLADPEPPVRLAALLALGELGPPARRAIHSALGDPLLAGLARRLLDLHAT